MIGVCLVRCPLLFDILAEAQYAFQGLALPTLASIKLCGKIGHFPIAKERLHEPAHQHFQPDQ